MTESIIPANPDVGDLMSYADLVWTSDYTRDAIVSELRDQASAVSVAGAVPQVVGPVVAMSGLLDPGGGSAEFSRVSILEPDVIRPSKLPGILLNPHNTAGEFELHQLDSAEKLLARHAFDSHQMTTSVDVKKHQTFAFAAAHAPGAKVFRIVHQGTVLAEAVASDHAPAVRLRSPRGGEVFGDTLIVDWDAQDADGDPLLFDVQYSADNGRSWTLVAGDVISTTVTLELDTLSGSEGQGRVRVIASDGVNTATDSSESDEKFTVEGHKPRPRITHPVEGHRVASGAGFNLRGNAWDAEDGYLEDRALVWTHVGRGQLGTGEGVYVNGLPPGTHAFTLSATDSDGQSTRTGIEIEVYDPLMLYLPMLTLGG
jgi:hypothetical protein